MLGDEAIVGVFLTLQHINDVVKQKQYFVLWKHLATFKEEKLNLAYLEDRILLNEIGTQKYGTQFVIDKITNERKLVPLINKDSVDYYRKSVGLIPLKKYLKLTGNKE
jgi:hypothetical protein